MAKTQLELEGGEGWAKLVETFAKVRSEGEALLSTIAKTGFTSEEAAKRTMAAQDKANASLKANSVLVAQGGKLMKELSDAGVSMGKATTDAYKKLIDANQRLADARKRASQDGQEYLQREVEAAKKLVDVAKGDLIGSFEGVTDAEKKAVLQLVDLAEEMQGLGAQGDKLKAMAEILQEQAEAGGKAQLTTEQQAAASEELVAAQKQLAQALADVRDRAEAAASELGPLLGGGDGDTAGEVSDLKAVAQASREAMEADQDRVLSVEEVTAAQKKAMEAAQEASRATAIGASEETKARNEQAAAVARAAAQEAQRKGFIEDTIEAIKRLSAEQKKAKSDEDLQRINQELAEAKANLKELQQVGMPDLGPATEQVKTIRVRFREATEEVNRLVEKLHGGQMTPEIAAAAQEAANLKRQMTDVNLEISAFDPEAKFNVMAGVTESILGGFTAMQGVLSLVNDGEGDQAIKNLAKVQGMLAVFQGGAAFLKDFGDKMKLLNAFVIKNTTATTANAAAQGVNATATTAGATATGFLTGAVRTLTAAMAANPLIAAAGLLLAIGAAMVLMGDDSEEQVAKVDSLIASLNELRQLNDASLSNLQRKNDLEDELKLIQEGNTEEGKRELIVSKAANARRTIINQIEQSEENIGRLKALQAGLSGEALDKSQKELDAEYARLKTLKDQIPLLELQRKVDLAGFDAGAAARKQAEAESAHKEAMRRMKEEADFKKKLEQEAADASKKFIGAGASASASSNIAQLEYQANEAARKKDFSAEADYRKEIIRIKAEAEQKEITKMSIDMQRKQALVVVERTMGKAAYEAMNEDQRNALADKAIMEGKADLTEEQLAAIKQLRTALMIQSAQELAKVEVDEAAKRIEAANKEIEVQERLVDQRAELAQMRIDGAEGDKDRIVEIQRQQGIAEEDITTNTEKAKLLIQAKALQDRIDLMKQAPNLTESDRLAIEKLEVTLDGLKKKINEMPQVGSTGWWAKLLGVDEEGLAKLQPLIGSAMQSIQKALTNVLFDARIQQIDRYIDKLHQSMSETQAAIDAETDAQKEGNANTLDAEKARMVQLQEMEKKAIEEREKIAQRQRIIDAVAAQSGMILSVINIAKNESSKGLIGVAIAAGAITALLAIVGAAKSKAAETAKFREGTEYVALGGNKRGIDTVPAMLTEGEAVVRVKENKAMPKLFKGIHRRDKGMVKDGIMQAADHYGFSLEDLLAEYGSKAIEERKPRMPLKVMDAISDRSDRIADMRERAVAGGLIEGYMARLAASNEELVRLDKGRPTVIPLGPNKYKLVQGDVSRTVTIRDDA